jgi:hypothetical protein
LIEVLVLQGMNSRLMNPCQPGTGEGTGKSRFRFLALVDGVVKLIDDHLQE